MIRLCKTTKCSVVYVDIKDKVRPADGLQTEHNDVG